MVMKRPERSQEKSATDSRLSDIQKAVKELRSALGKSQQQFANDLGLSITTVARYEIGTREPDYKSLVLFAQAAAGLHHAGRNTLLDIFENALADELGVSRYFLEKGVVAEEMGKVAELIRAGGTPKTRDERLAQNTLLFIAELSKRTNAVSAHIGEAMLILENLDTVQPDKTLLLEGVRAARKHLATALQQLEDSNNVTALLDSFQEYKIDERNDNKKAKKKR
jgi:transcriptional regulator with XRE-family HTH domain